MKLIVKLFILLIFILSVFTGCLRGEETITKSDKDVDIKMPQFTKYEVANKPQEIVLDVLNLEFKNENIVYTDVGDMRELKFILKGVNLRYSGGRTVNYTGDLKTSVFESELPIYFLENTKNAEGIIVHQGIPYSYYYNNGEAFVKCLETRFNDYFKEDKSYSDFIEWARIYTPSLDDEDFLSS